MKQIIKIRTILLLIPLYLAVTGIYSERSALPVFNPSEHPTDIPSGERSFFSTSYLFTAIPENQVSGSNQVPAPSLKNHINDYTAHPGVASLSFSLWVTRCVLFSEQIVPGFPKTSIAFPFNYFW